MEKSSFVANPSSRHFRISSPGEPSARIPQLSLSQPRFPLRLRKDNFGCFHAVKTSFDFPVYPPLFSTKLAPPPDENEQLREEEGSRLTIGTPKPDCLGGKLPRVRETREGAFAPVAELGERVAIEECGLESGDKPERGVETGKRRKRRMGEEEENKGSFSSFSKTDSR